MPDTIINSFPGYEFVQDEKGYYHNMYRDTDIGFGGYIYSEPGMYTNVALLDIASMHPTSIIMMNKLGEYTKKYSDLKQARVYIKHHDYESAKKLFDGKLEKYLTSDEEADALANALKYPLNAFYGLCSASFDNPARDSRDRNNIVALRGALFMRTLQDEIIAKGFRPISFRTDSVKIPNATAEIIRFIQDFGRQYGYEFEHECTYEKFCLVNDSAYVAKYDDKGIRNKGGKHAGEWTATAAEFQVPFVFKKLFSREPIEFKDFCETKSVQKGALYLDMNENLPDVTALEKERDKLYKKWLKENIRDVTEELEGYDLAIAEGHNYKFVGRVGEFCPVKPGCGGGVLYRGDNGKYYAAAGTTGYRWLESELVKNLKMEDCIDVSYYEKMADEALEHISQFGDAEWFRSDDPVSPAYNLIEGGPEEVEFTAMNKPE